MDLGRREDELHVGRWLFERLQEGVPRLVRQHVHFVDDVDLEAIARGAERDALLELSHLVDAVVRGAVDLLDVDVVAGRDLFARRAHLAGDGRRAGRLAVGADAVEALGEEARARRLADAADAGEEERVGDAVGGDRVGERAGHVLLTGEILERLRAVLAGEDEVAHKAGIADARSERERRRGPFGYDAFVPHDAHFLERLDRVKTHETDLALGLYRDHELVRFILSHAKLPAEAERVAIALDHGADGPWIVVAREGAFVTCLGRGMSTKNLPIITRAQLDAWGEKHEEVRRRVALAQERGASKGHVAPRVMKAGRWLTREDFLALTAIAAPIAGGLFSRYLDTVGEFSEALPTASIIGAPRSELDRDVYTELAQSAWAMGHLALAINEGADREFLRVVFDATQHVAGSCLAWTYLTETVAMPFFVRNAWCAAKMGKLVLAYYKAQYARPVTQGFGHMEAAHALLAISARHTSLRAEALKAIEAQSPSDDERTATVRSWFRNIAGIFERDADALLRDAFALGRVYFHGLAEDLVEGSKYRFATPDDVPEDLARTAALNVWASVIDVDIAPYFPAVVLLAARSQAEDFYYPADVQRDVRVNRTLGEGISLAEIHRKRFPAHVTVRAEAKPGRNEPCSCGSGKKYKKCCGAAA